MTLREKGYGGDLVVVSHTLDGRQMQGLVKGIGFFLRYVSPIAVFVGDTPTMKFGGDLIKSRVRNVEEIYVSKNLNPDENINPERLTNQILAKVDSSFLGIIVIAEMLNASYLADKLHVKGQYLSPRQPGYGLGIDR